MKVNSFMPRQEGKVQFAISADDCLLHFEANERKARQLEDDRSIKDLISMLQVATLFLGKPEDRTCLYEAFAKQPWQQSLRVYRSMFEEMGLSPIPIEHIAYNPRSDFYAPLAAQSSDLLPELLTVYLISGSNRKVHETDRALEVSRDVNSKIMLARRAGGAGIPVPQTMVTRNAELESEHVESFIDSHGPVVMLKIMGLAGARNVTEVSSVEAAQAYLADFPAHLEVVLQERLDVSEYTEMTVDLCVSDQDVFITNLRKILFADGLWVGNYLGPDLELSEQQRAPLLRVGEYLRQRGYSAPEGLNCGIDFFLNNETGEVVVTEINARYTGGLMPAFMLEQLAATDRPAIVCFALVERSKFDQYLAFNQAHLYGKSAAPFAAVPLGFSPYTQVIEGVEQVFVWQMVVGDLAAFNRAKRDALGIGNLYVTEQIEASLGG